MISDFVAGGELALRSSDSETRRFGFGVSRLTVPVDGAASDQDIAAMVCGTTSSLVIVRADARRTGLVQALRGLDGVECLHADTLIYYRWSLKRLSPSPWHSPGFAIDRTVSHHDIAEVLRESFRGYRNHYSANPRLADSVTVTAYEEWAESLMRDPATKVFVARETVRNSVVGFVLLAQDDSRRFAEVLLNAVHPLAQRSGIYSALMRSAAEYVESHRSTEYLYISTQRENRAVLGAWNKLGLEPFLAINTFHVMRGFD